MFWGRNLRTVKGHPERPSGIQYCDVPVHIQSSPIIRFTWPKPRWSGPGTGPSSRRTLPRFLISASAGDIWMQETRNPHLSRPVHSLIPRWQYPRCIALMEGPPFREMRSPPLLYRTIVMQTLCAVSLPVLVRVGVNWRHVSPHFYLGPGWITKSTGFCGESCEVCGTVYEPWSGGKWLHCLRWVIDKDNSSDDTDDYYNDYNDNRHHRFFSRSLGSGFIFSERIGRHHGEIPVFCSCISFFV